jgi:hypothetical protein
MAIAQEDLAAFDAIGTIASCRRDQAGQVRRPGSQGRVAAQVGTQRNRESVPGAARMA